jgi:hypothetical protein
MKALRTTFFFLWSILLAFHYSAGDNDWLIQPGRIAVTEQPAWFIELFFFGAGQERNQLRLLVR